ncbi:MAG: cyclic nucleotide-binding domain-containing protein [Spirochaetota bacterium]
MVDPGALEKYSLFGGLVPAEIELVRTLLGRASLTEGEAVVVEGEPSDRIYFILEGRVAVSKRGIPIADLVEGDTFGEMEFLDVMPSVATIRAKTSTELATISNRALYELSKMSLKTYAIIVMNLARDLSRRLRRMDELATDRPSS